MPNFNQLIIVGHLTRDPQFKYLANQTPVCDGGIATSRKYKSSSGEEREDTCFLDWCVFGKAAEVINEYMRKGSAIMLIGRLAYEQWEDKQGGGKRSKHKMIVEGFQFLGGRKDRDDSNQEEQPYPRTRQSIASNRAPAQETFDEQQFKEDDIPF